VALIALPRGQAVSRQVINDSSHIAGADQEQPAEFAEGKPSSCSVDFSKHVELSESQSGLFKRTSGFAHEQISAAGHPQVNSEGQLYRVCSCRKTTFHLMTILSTDAKSLYTISCQPEVRKSQESRRKPRLKTT